MNRSHEQGAALLLTVLLLAVLAVLVGFGRVAMYRNQVKLRLDREREIQQELATRSVMRWLEKYYQGEFTGDYGDLPSTNTPFLFPTVRGYMGVTLHPADPIFPRKLEDFDICSNQIPYRGYVHASSGIQTSDRDENSTIRIVSLADRSEKTIGEVRALWIDVAEEQAAAMWTDSDFGLRYLVYVTDFCKQDFGVSDSDLLRFSITPLGEPLRSGDGDPAATYAIWAEQDIPKEWPGEGASSTLARLRLYVRVPQEVGFVEKCVIRDISVPADKSKGIQLAATKASLVRQLIAKDAPNAIRSTGTYGTVDLDDAVHAGFTKEFADACKEGIRLTVELVVRRPRVEDDNRTDYRTAISKIAVTPAYEYSTDLEWTERDGSLTKETSTVIRCDPGVHGETNEGTFSTVTYDTHGTEANRKNHVDVGRLGE